jgi:hypothetical protein
MAVSARAGSGPSVTEGLALWLPFEEQGDALRDHSGHGHDGTVHGARTEPGGKRGQALVLDGKDDYVDLGNPPELQLRKDFTVAAWIMAMRSETAGGILVKSYGNPEQARRGMEFYVSGNTLVSYFWDDATRYFRGIAKLPASPEPCWRHVVLQHDSSMKDHQMRMYVDGKPAALALNYETVQSIPKIRAVPDTLKIGCFRTGYQHFHGKIDELLIYTRVLTAQEIGRLYREQK